MLPWFAREEGTKHMTSKYLEFKKKPTLVVVNQQLSQKTLGQSEYSMCVCMQVLRECDAIRQF